MPANKKTLTIEQLDVVRTMLGEDKSWADIGEALGLSASGAWRAAHRSAGPSALIPNQRESCNALKRKAATCLFEGGFTRLQIASVLGVSVNWVYRWIPGKDNPLPTSGPQPILT